MRRILLVVCLVTLAGFMPLSAQAQTPVERTLTKLENDWTIGLVKSDTMLFKKITDPRFIYTEDAAVMTRADVLKGIVTNPDKVVSSHNEDMKVHEFGSAAIVTGILVVNLRSKKGPYTIRYRFTDTWQNSGGAWRLIGAQDYVIPARK